MRNFLSCLFFVISVALLASCSDQGCIEADDFGEYDTQTLEVPANNSDGACNYDPSKEITDASQGSGLKSCFISGTVKIYDDNVSADGTTTVQTSTTGCRGLPDIKFRNICINQCVAQCNANIGTDSFGTPEPTWVATSLKSGGGRNGGVDIKPNSIIYIRAIGNVSLGSKFSYPSFFIDPQDFMPQSKKNDWRKQIIDVKTGKSLNVAFSGRFSDGTEMLGVAVDPVTNTVIPVSRGVAGQIGSGSSMAIDEKAYNAVRRLVAYVQPVPMGYAFDSSQNDEKLGAINVPLNPDANLWACNYGTGGDENEANCYNRSYKENGYPRVDDAAIAGVFPITSQTKSTQLGEIGGIIRWKDDGLLPESFDPFRNGNVNINCSSGTCPNAASVPIDQGMLVGDIAAGNSRIISPTAPSLVSFKYLLDNVADCDRAIDIEIRTAAGALITTKSISVNNRDWSNRFNSAIGNPQKISLEAGQQIIVKQSVTSTFGGNSCGIGLAVRFSKFHDIQITESGLVSFAILGGINNSRCTINARIVNPKGNFIDDAANGIEADYYEYEDFNRSNLDPLRAVDVPVLPAVNGVWYTDAVNNGSVKAFVRNGQIIRFSPESWNATWTNAGGTRRCGVGMAMRIEPRPALLCRGYDSDRVTPTGCHPKIVNSKFVGCDEIADDCSNQDSPAYCPFSDCVFPVTCQAGVAPDYQRICNDLPAGNVPSSCSLSSTNTTQITKCRQCSAKRLEMARTPMMKLSDNPLAKCYNLESYKGKVSNIPLTGFSDSDLGVEAKAKGLRKISSFDGTVGTLGQFSPIGKTDSYAGNQLFQFAQTLNIAKDGRLRFILLDGQNFLDIDKNYSDNSNAGTAYTGLNGLKVDISSFLEFNNGEWLEARLCREIPNQTGPNITTCRDINFPLNGPNTVPNQPELVRLADPVGSNFTPQSSTTYKFDPYGNLLRYRTPEARGECVNVLVGDTYYCHTSPEPVSNLRITFKIKDPEAGNCSTQNPINNPVDSAGVPKFAYDGIMITNPKYRQNECRVGGGTGPINGIMQVNSAGTDSNCVLNPNVGATCVPADDAVEGGCVKEFRCVNRYANNSGKYYVTVRVKMPGANISNIVNDVISPVIEVMDGKKDKSTIGQAERIYKMIISDPRYQAILTMSLVIMYTFYGLGYLMGVTEAGLQDMIQKVLKISIIYLFVGPQGWEWFDKIVVKFFKDGTDYLSFLMASSFDNSPGIKNALENYDFYDKSILFGSVDKVFGMFFSATVQKKVAALLFASIFGWAYLLIIYYGIILYIYAVGNAILLYLTSQVFISILFVLGPLFFIFTLFNQTKEMFDSWLKQLIGFSLQQIFLLTTLAFFNMMMYEVIKMALGYKICWDEIWTIKILIRITLMSFWTIASLPPRTTSQSDVGNVGNSDGIPSFFTILFIWVIAKLMHQFVTFMTDLAASISGGMQASTLGQGLKAAAESVRSFAGKRIEEMWDKTGIQATKRLDKFLFDSGEMAEKERKQKKAQNSKDFKDRKALTEAGNKAVTDYKKNNAAELAKMSKEEQQKKLTDVKNEAISKQGKKMGLSDVDVERLKKDKGLKYVGENVFGMALQAARQSVVKGGNLGTSIDDAKVKTKLSGSEAKAALKNTDSEGRKAIVDAVKSGDLQVGRSGVYGTLKSAPKNIARAVSNPFKEMGKALGIDKLAPSKEYDEARKQLENEGEIDKMRTGTNWSRSKEDKDKIRERMQKNSKERGKDKKEMSGLGTVAKVELQAEIFDELENKEGGKFTYGSNALSEMVGREKTVSGVIDRYKRGKQLKKEATKTRGDKIAEHLENKASKAGKELQEERTNLETIEGGISEIESDQDVKDYESAQNTLKNPEAKAEDKKQAQEKISALDSNKGFNSKKAELHKAYAAKNQSLTKINNLSTQFNKAEHGANAAKEAMRMRQYAQGYISNKNTDPEKLAQAKEIAAQYDEIVGKKYSESDGGTIDKLSDFASQDYGEFMKHKAKLTNDQEDLNLDKLFAEPDQDPNSKNS